MMLLKSFFIFIGFSCMILLSFYLITENDKIPQKNIVNNIKIESIVNNCKKTQDDELSILFD
jgi:hypothetical protein